MIIGGIVTDISKFEWWSLWALVARVCSGRSCDPHLRRRAPSLNSWRQSFRQGGLPKDVALGGLHARTGMEDAHIETII
eukprot:5416999-Amphidinium_carterae.1